MPRKSIQEIDFPSFKDDQNKVCNYKKRMPIVRCTCGSEILLLPDVKAMNLAVKNHTAKHRRAFKNSRRLSELLTRQVIILASKLNPPN